MAGVSIMALEGVHGGTFEPLNEAERPPQQSGGAVHSRSRRGCLTCRRRKVKCDEKEDTCANCERLGLDCEHDSRRRPVQRSRRNKACERCRSKKTRCSSTLPSGPCDQCRRLGLECPIDNYNSNEDVSQPYVNSGVISGASSWTAPLSTTQSNLPEGQELHQLLEAYFNGPHHFCFYTFIHQATFMQMLDNELIPRSLLLVVCATSLRFSNPDSKVADAWADESRPLVMNQIFALPSMSTLQTLLLLQRYEWLRGAHISAWFLAGLAIRLTHALQLNVEPADNDASRDINMPVTVRETRRRLLWSCFVIDSFTEAGRQPLSGLRIAGIETKLPCDERAFQNGSETNMEGLSTFYEGRDVLSLQGMAPSYVRGGISAFLVSVTVLRSQILEYTVPYHPLNRGHAPSQAPWNLEAPFYQYRQRLDDWCRLLPEDLVFDPERLRIHRPQRMASFMALHCLFHGCYCDLYRIGSYLTATRFSHNQPRRPIPPPESFLQHCAQGRLKHAFAIAHVISVCAKYITTELDPVVSLCACLSIRVLTTERRAGDSTTLSIPDQTIAETLDPVFRVVRSTALRSQPIRKLFVAIGKMAELHGYHVNISDMEDETLVPTTIRPSRPPSPSLTTYGTFGTIQDSIARSDTFSTGLSTRNAEAQQEMAQIHNADAMVSGPSAGRSNITTSSVASPMWDELAYDNADWNVNGVDWLDPHALQVASNWADGSLEHGGAMPCFDWTDQNLSLDTTDWIMSL